MSEQSCCKPVITYPCLWSYRLIGEDRQALAALIEETLAGGAAYTVTEGNVSSGGRYLSLNVETTVPSEEERLRLYRVFAGSPAVKVAL
ncbi:MAG: DUF493 domain-containing protein [Desulfobulbus sp.]|jgi:putative lipoic acid-binding regulatory protein